MEAIEMDYLRRSWSVIRLKMGGTSQKSNGVNRRMEKMRETATSSTNFLKMLISVGLHKWIKE